MDWHFLGILVIIPPTDYKPPSLGSKPWLLSFGFEWNIQEVFIVHVNPCCSWLCCFYHQTLLTNNAIVWKKYRKDKASLVISCPSVTNGNQVIIPCKAMNQFNMQVLLKLLIVFVLRASVICFFCKQVYNSSFSACKALQCLHIWFSLSFFWNKKRRFLFLIRLKHRKDIEKFL